MNIAYYPRGDQLAIYSCHAKSNLPGNLEARRLLTEWKKKHTEYQQATVSHFKCDSGRWGPLPQEDGVAADFAGKNTDSSSQKTNVISKPGSSRELYERVSYLAFISLGFLNSKTEITTTILYNWKGSE